MSKVDAVFRLWKTLILVSLQKEEKDFVRRWKEQGRKIPDEYYTGELVASAVTWSYWEFGFQHAIRGYRKMGFLFNNPLYGLTYLRGYKAGLRKKDVPGSWNYYNAKLNGSGE